MKRRRIVLLVTLVALVTLMITGCISSSIGVIGPIGSNNDDGIINARDYAVGDGKTDDTKALQKMLDHCFSLKKKVIIDFGGGDYLISEPLLLPAGHGVTLQNAAIKASKTFTEGRFLIESGKKGKSGSFSNEDIYFDNIIFDVSHRGGGLLLQSYNRAVITRSAFRHFKTIGLHLAGWSHEATVDSVYFNEYTWDEWTATKTNPTRYGTALKAEAPDNHFSKVIVAIAKKGIEVTGKYNLFDNIHVWGCEKQGIHLATSFVSINQAFIDGVQLQIDDPWHVEISNSKFYGVVSDPGWSFIVLKPTKQNASITGLKIKDSSFHNAGKTVRGLTIDNSGGSFNSTQIKECFISDNSFVNVTPFATKYKKSLTKTNSKEWKFDYSSVFPIGSVQSVTYGFKADSGFPNYKVKALNGKTVTMATDESASGTFWVEADVNVMN